MCTFATRIALFFRFGKLTGSNYGVFKRIRDGVRTPEQRNTVHVSAFAKKQKGNAFFVSQKRWPVGFFFLGGGSYRIFRKINVMVG